MVLTANEAALSEAITAASDGFVELHDDHVRRTVAELNNLGWRIGRRAPETTDAIRERREVAGPVTDEFIQARLWSAIWGNVRLGSATSVSVSAVVVGAFDVVTIDRRVARSIDDAILFDVDLEAVETLNELVDATFEALCRRGVIDLLRQEFSTVVELGSKQIAQESVSKQQIRTVAEAMIDALSLEALNDDTFAYVSLDKLETEAVRLLRDSSDQPDGLLAVADDVLNLMPSIVTRELIAAHGHRHLIWNLAVEAATAIRSTQNTSEIAGQLQTQVEHAMTAFDDVRRILTVSKDAAGVGVADAIELSRRTRRDIQQALDSMLLR